jgi:D-aminopeptidase
MTRYRDLGLSLGLLPPGPRNAITDVAGVRVGVTTLIEGEGALEIGSGPIRTGVTAIVPHDGIREEPLYAGTHTLNGSNGSGSRVSSPRRSRSRTRIASVWSTTR